MATATVNNIVYDFASIQIDCGGRIVEGAVSISYKHSVKVEKFWGTSRTALGRTDGVYECDDCQIELRKSDADDLRAYIGKGYMRESKKFQLSVTYGKDGDPTRSDELVDCRIIEEGDDHKQGPGAITETLMLSVMHLKKKGLDPMKL